MSSMYSNSQTVASARSVGANRWQATTLAFLACVSCGEPPLCDPELKLDTAYVSTVSEIYNHRSSAQFDSRFAQSSIADWPSCAGFDGLVPGAAISLRTTRATNDASCRALSGDVLSLPNGEKWEESFALSVSGGFERYNIFTAEGEVMSGPCRGPYRVTLGRPSNQVSVFSTTAPGALPSLLLGRSFWPAGADAGATCSQWCADTFVAQLAVGKWKEGL